MTEIALLTNCERALAQDDAGIVHVEGVSHPHTAYFSSISKRSEIDLGADLLCARCLETLYTARHTARLCV